MFSARRLRPRFCRLVSYWVFSYGSFAFPLQTRPGTINTAVLIYLILKLIRAGHYFPPEFFFFVFAYVFSYLHEQAHQRDTSIAGTT